MPPFTISPTVWGLAIAVRRALSDGERALFSAELAEACRQAATEAEWSAVLDLRGADLGAVPMARLLGYLGLAKTLGAARVAALTSTWGEGRHLTEAFATADLATMVRVVVVEGEDDVALHSAHQWVANRVEPGGAPGFLTKSAD